MILNTASTISKRRTQVNPLRNVSIINLNVDSKMINNIKRSNHLFVINFIQKIRNLLVWENIYKEFSHSVFLNILLMIFQSLIFFSTFVYTLYSSLFSLLSFSSSSSSSSSILSFKVDCVAFIVDLPKVEVPN